MNIDALDEQLNSGVIPNPYIADCDKSKPAPMADRTTQILYAMRTGNHIPEPQRSDNNLVSASRYPKPRHERYFAAWCLDQWERVAVELKRGEFALDERVIKTYKNDIIQALYDDFESGKAYLYVDDWYKSFPNGGFFNPVRYENFYKDEMNIAHRVEEHIQCYETHPAIQMLLNSKNRPSDFDHSFVENGGMFVINYPTDSDVHELLEKKVFEIDDDIAERIGEPEGMGYGQRVFVTRGYGYGDGVSTCAVLYDGFDTELKHMLPGSVKNAITEAIPMHYWRDPRLYIDTEPHKVTYGEMETVRIDIPAIKYDIRKTYRSSYNQGAVLNDCYMQASDISTGLSFV